MKNIILAIITIIGTATMAMAQDPQKVTIRYGHQKHAGGTGLTLKFVSVVEDSRCPVGVDCIWAGNARIQVFASNSQGSKMLTMNTGAGPLGDQYGGYAIRLVSLTPQPPQHGKIKTEKYTAVFAISRLGR
jgi:hypothetical protein